MAGGGRTWIEVPEGLRTEIRSYLVREGGELLLHHGLTEVWRVRLSEATLTCYQNGTIHSTPSEDAAVLHAWHFIEERWPRFVASERMFLIGLDETGKGQLVGHLTLAGALVPLNLVDDVRETIGLANTKVKHPFAYWDALFVHLESLRDQGLAFVVEKIPPWAVDRYKLNDLMDVTYRWILRNLLQQVQPEACRVVVDDFGLRHRLRVFLETLRTQGAEVVVEPRADDRYLEAKVASVLAKREFQKELVAMNGKEFQVGECSVGSGMASDTKTIAWLDAWKESCRPWPSFVKRSPETIAQIGEVKPPKKTELPSGVSGHWTKESP